MLSNAAAHTAQMQVHAATATDRERAEFRAHMAHVAPARTDLIAQHRVTHARVVEAIIVIPDQTKGAW